MKLNTPEEQLALLAAEHAGKEVEIYNGNLNKWLVKSVGRWWFKTCTYRVKPGVRMINGIECPMPLTELNPWQFVYVPSFSLSGGALMVGSCHEYIGKMLVNGLIFATPEDARTVRDALLNYKRGE